MTDNRYNILSSANLHSDAVSVRRLASMKKPAPIDYKYKELLQLYFLCLCLCSLLRVSWCFGSSRYFVAYTLHNNNERLQQLYNRHNQQHNMIFLFQEHLWKTTSIPRVEGTRHVSRATAHELAGSHCSSRTMEGSFRAPCNIIYCQWLSDFKLLDIYGLQLQKIQIYYITISIDTLIENMIFGDGWWRELFYK